MWRTGMWVETLRQDAGVPKWSEAIAAKWWRWSGHAARYPTTPMECIVSTAIQWSDAWWRWTIQAVLRTDRQRLGSASDDWTTWCSRQSCHEMPWNHVDEDRSRWQALELEFVVLRTQRGRQQVPAGRWMLRHTDESLYTKSP